MTDDNLSRLLQKYVFDFDKESEGHNLKCILCKKLLVNAYQSSCGCQYCQGCIIEYLEKNNEYCCGGKEWCTDEPLVLDVNVVRNVVLNRKIANLRVVCPNLSCTHRTELALMEDHLRMCDKQPSCCPYFPIGCDHDNISKETMSSHLHGDTLKHTELLIDWIQNLKNEMDLVKLDVNSMREESRNKDMIVSDLRSENKSQKKELLDQRNRIEILEQYRQNMENSFSIITSGIDDLPSLLHASDTNSNNLGKMDLTIEQFESKRRNNEIVFSPHFYSHLNGYKIRLEVHPGGSDSAKGTYLSAFFAICKGEYDDRLSWPCKYIFEIGIVNQRTGSTNKSWIFSYDSMPDDCKCALNKPTIENNSGLGGTEIISHDNLNTTKDLMVKDRVVVRCIVRSPR